MAGSRMRPGLYYSDLSAEEQLGCKDGLSRGPPQEPGHPVALEPLLSSTRALGLQLLGLIRAAGSALPPRCSSGRSDLVGLCRPEGEEPLGNMDHLLLS